MRFTDEQQAAIDIHDRNLIVTAGAGSGKTRVLVERFMALLDANPDWSLPAIVAITFTEKAAREMRDRVRVALERRIGEAISAGDDAALDRWATHQAALTHARIGTIHSLCARLLRNNPAEARLDPAFDMLDETEAAIIRTDAVEDALAQLAAEDRPGTALLTAYGVSAVRAVLDAYAPPSAADIVRQQAFMPDDERLARWRDAWEKAYADGMQRAAHDDDLYAALNAVPPGSAPAGDKLTAIWEQVYAYTPALLTGSSPAEFVDALDTLTSVIKLNVGSAQNWGSKAAVDDAKTALKFIRARLNDLRASLPPALCERDDAALDWLAAWFDAIELAADCYAQRKAERNALDFDDLESHARDLLDHHPAVAARYQHEFKHILVDEFQDTNDAQRAIVYALAGAGPDGPGGRLFVVGDPKQSIYAFRGADVSVFGAVRDDLVDWGGQECTLAQSFRTHRTLVDGFNALFGTILQAGDPTDPASRYEIDLGQPMTASRESDPALPTLTQPLTIFTFPRPDSDAYPDFNADNIRQWEAWTLAQHIHDLVDRQTPVFDREDGKYRPMTYGDVAILFQAMTRAPLVEEVFKVAQLPYVTIAGQGYYDRPEVWDMLNLLRALHNPADDLALAVALRSPLFGLSDDALFALRLLRDRHNEPYPLWDALFKPRVPHFPASDETARDFARDVLCELRELAGRAPIADLLIRALDLTGYLAVVTGLPDGIRRRGNVEKLIALARQSGRVSLGAFNAYARDLTAREVREGEAVVDVAGAVTIMSVHASKGLEFPVVILADASWSRTRRFSLPFTVDPDAGPACQLPTDDPDADDPPPFAWHYAGELANRRDQAERRRLLYVGATRAQDYLIVSGSLHRLSAHAWLRQWLDALGVVDADLAPDDEGAILHFPWGRCALHVPQSVTLPAHLAAPSPAASAWDDPALRAGVPIPGAEPFLPPLLAEIPVDPVAPAQALTATDLAALGRAQFYDPATRGRAAFRQALLHDAPDPVRPLPERTIDPGNLRRFVGDIVHRALRAWILPGNVEEEDLLQRLRTYAWETGLSDPAQIETAALESYDLLAQFADSTVRQALDRAQQVYRELPFVYRAGERTIHGVIDVLYFDGKTWTVLDFKTAQVDGGGAWENAKRYFLQVGIYARAVEARTGQTPRAQLYYIHPAREITVRPDHWQPALQRLDDDLRAALDPAEQAENQSND